MHKIALSYYYRMILYSYCEQVDISMLVGGEFYQDEAWYVEQPVISTDRAVFLNGGKACLVVICDYLRDHGINRILLPSYLCPTIVNTLERCGMTCEYYPIRPDLSIDLDALAERLTGHRAIYFINYFGFQHSQATRDALSALREKGVIVVEDNAQAGFAAHTIGDFVFNSVRKLAPFDGGYLLSRNDVQPYLAQYRGRPNRRLPVIREYREQLAKYLFRDDGDHNSLTNLYEKAEALYEQDLVVEGDEREKWNIEHQDWNAIRQVCRRNYIYLLEGLSVLEGLTPIFHTLQPDDLPMGLPVYIHSVPRDKLFDELGEAGIGLTIHWEGIRHDPRLNRDPVAAEMADRMLTLVIDQRTTCRQLDYLIERLGLFLSPGH